MKLIEKQREWVSCGVLTVNARETWFISDVDFEDGVVRVIGQLYRQGPYRSNLALSRKLTLSL